MGLNSGYGSDLDPGLQMQRCSSNTPAECSSFDFPLVPDKQKHRVGVSQPAAGAAVGIAAALRGHVPPLCASTEKLPGASRVSATRDRGRALVAGAAPTGPTYPVLSQAKLLLTSPSPRDPLEQSPQPPSPVPVGCSTGAVRQRACSRPATNSSEKGPQPRKQNFSPLSPCGGDGRWVRYMDGCKWCLREGKPQDPPGEPDPDIPPAGKPLARPLVCKVSAKKLGPAGGAAGRIRPGTH